MTATAHMPLLERLRKGANCVGFLDGAPEPAADVADMLRKAAGEIERLEKLAKEQGQEIAITRERDEKLEAALERLHHWASASNDWRPDSRLGREVSAALGDQQATQSGDTVECQTCGASVKFGGCCEKCRTPTDH